MSDYAARIARLQEIMQAQGYGLAVLSCTDQMRYLTGYVEGAHERLLALFVPAQGQAVFVVPTMNAQAARANPAGIKGVSGLDGRRQLAAAGDEPRADVRPARRRPRSD